MPRIPRAPAANTARPDAPPTPSVHLPDAAPDPTAAAPSDTSLADAALEEHEAGETAPLNAKVQLRHVSRFRLERRRLAGTPHERRATIASPLITASITKDEVGPIAGSGHYIMTWWRVARGKSAKTGKSTKPREEIYGVSAFEVEMTEPATGPGVSNGAVATETTPDPGVLTLHRDERLVPGGMSKLEQAQWSWVDGMREMVNRQTTATEQLAASFSAGVTRQMEQAAQGLALAASVVQAMHVRSENEIRQRADMAGQMIAMQERFASNALITNVLVPVANRAVNRFLPETPTAGGAGNPLDKLDAAMGRLEKIEAAASRLEGMERKLETFNRLGTALADKFGVELPAGESATVAADAPQPGAVEIVTPVSSDPEDHVPV